MQVETLVETTRNSRFRYQFDLRSIRMNEIEMTKEKMKNKLFWLTSCCYQKSWLDGINLFIHHHSSADSRFDSPRVSRRENGGKVCARISVVRNLIFITTLKSPRGWIKREFSDRFLCAMCFYVPPSDGRVRTCGRNKSHISQSLFNKFLSDLVKALFAPFSCIRSANSLLDSANTN